MQIISEINIISDFISINPSYIPDAYCVLFVKINIYFPNIRLEN